MKEYLYRVGLVHKRTGESFALDVWAKNVDEATHSLCGPLIGYYCEYRWCGSGPVYGDDNEVVSRVIDVPLEDEV